MTSGLESGSGAGITGGNTSGPDPGLGSGSGLGPGSGSGNRCRFRLVIRMTPSSLQPSGDTHPLAGPRKPARQ